MSMKKTCRLLPLLGAVLLLAGCGGDSGDYSKYVTLGDYQNLSVTKTVEEVTQERLDEYEKEQLNEYTDYEPVDGPVKQGQMVSVSLLAKDGDEVVYDFTDDGYDLVIGDAEFGEQVDEALIGAVDADELDLEVSYDSDFEDAMLSGKDITYHIVVNSISDVIYPELTDEFVKENFGVVSVEKWHQSMKEELQQSYEEDAEETVRDWYRQRLMPARSVAIQRAFTNKKSRKPRVVIRAMRICFIVHWTKCMICWIWTRPRAKRNISMLWMRRWYSQRSADRRT